MKERHVLVNDLMQINYTYLLTENTGRNFHAEFLPELTPKQMLELGVFGGKYMTDCKAEFPADWFLKARLCSTHYEPELNCFGIRASQSLSVWQNKGWIYKEDPRGWFQWYCRYYMGRRCPDDERQVKRWKAMRRHINQIKKNCGPYEFSCRKRQRQAVLHWAYNSMNM